MLELRIIRFLGLLNVIYFMWSVAGVYACDVAEAVSTSRRAVCVHIINKK